MSRKSRPVLAVVGLTALLGGAPSASGTSVPNLGAAESFGVLAGTAVVVSGPTEIIGNVGVSPATTVTGILPATIVGGGKLFRNDPKAQAAQRDVAIAYADLAGRPCEEVPLNKPGVHCLASLDLRQPLTLSGGADDVWVFRVVGPLTVAAGTAVQLSGGARGVNVYWAVGGSATLHERGAFVGTILALDSINMGRNVSFAGRAFAQRGSVTLDSDDVTFCCDPIAITPAVLPNGTVGQAYPPATLAAAGGTAPHTFTIFSGALPPGLTLAENGALSGTPMAAGDYTATLEAKESLGCSSIRTYDITVAAACPSITLLPESIPSPGGCGGYQQTFSASGGTPQYTFAATLPQTSGLTLTAGGVLTGTPVTGCTTFTITATDAAGCKSPPRTYTICGLTIAPALLPAGTVDVPYERTFIASGGTGPYELRLCGGKLPEGLTLSKEGKLSGTPTQVETQTFTVTAADTAGSGVGSLTLTLRIVCGGITISPLDPMLPPGSVCGPYSVKFGANGGTQPYTWTFSSEPPLTLTSTTTPSTLTLAGKPNAGTYSLTVTATDIRGCSDTRPFTLIILAAPAITVSPSSLPMAFPNVPYAWKVSAGGGAEPYTFGTADPLPEGLELKPAGDVVGTPAASAVSRRFKVVATDKNGCQGDGDVTICMPIAISPAALPNATLGVPYCQQLTATGGTDIDFRLLQPSNSWLSLTPQGNLCATPPATGHYSIEVRATDKPTACSADKTYVLTAGCSGIAFLPPPMWLFPLGTVGIFYSQGFTGTGGTGPYKFFVTEPLTPPPPGLTLAQNGTLSGFPTASGRFNFGIYAVDATGKRSCSQVYTIVIQP